MSNNKIKKVTLEYCLDVLENNELEEEVKHLVKLKDEVHKLRMEDRDNDEPYKISVADSFHTIGKFETKKADQMSS